MANNYSDEEQARWKVNMKKYQVSTGQDPTQHGRPPFQIFDPGKGDPWRELHLVDADNKGVTSLGPLQDPTGMTLGNALFLMECVNNYEYLTSRVQELEDERNNLKIDNAKLIAEIEELRRKLTEIKNEV